MRNYFSYLITEDEVSGRIKKFDGIFFEIFIGG